MKSIGLKERLVMKVLMSVCCVLMSFCGFADTPCSVISRSAERIELRTRMDKDAALFFKFAAE